VEGVELIISESSTILLSMTITKSIGTVRAYETDLQLGKQFRQRFPSRQRLRFRENYRVNRDYQVNRDYYRVNKDCARIRNKASAGDAVSSTISKSAATQFSVTITDSTGIVRTDKTRYHLGKQFW
jgi:hypothetical protein